MTGNQVNTMVRIKRLKDIHRRAVHLLILHGWDVRGKSGSSVIFQAVADDLGVKFDTLKHWRICENIKREHDRQLAIYQKNYYGITLADRKERIRVLDELYPLVSEGKPEIKLAILRAIRDEVGYPVAQSAADAVRPTSTNTGGEAQSYGEWLKLNPPHTKIS